MEGTSWTLFNEGYCKVWQVRGSGGGSYPAFFRMNRVARK